MITGPFGLLWAERVVTRMEIGELAAGDPPTPYRICRWFDLAPMIGGDLFIKLHAHGAQERHSKSLLGGGLSDLFMFLTAEAQRRTCELFYVTAWEMFLAVEAIRRRADPVEAVRMERANAPDPVATTRCLATAFERMMGYCLTVSSSNAQQSSMWMWFCLASLKV